MGTASRQGRRWRAEHESVGMVCVCLAPMPAKVGMRVALNGVLWSPSRHLSLHGLSPIVTVVLAGVLHPLLLSLHRIHFQKVARKAILGRDHC